MTCPLQPVIFHKRQCNLSRYFTSEGKIALGDIFASGDKIDKTANYLAGRRQAGLERNKCHRSMGG